MKSIIKNLIAPIAVGSMLASGAAYATGDVVKRTFCLWDPVGKSGDTANMFEDYKLEAFRWGADLTVKTYTDEKIAAEDFKAGKCDAVAVTTLRGRQFNPFTGSLDSVGSIPSYKHLKLVLNYLANPKMSKYMTNGKFEVAGIVPAGGVYLFLKDRAIDKPEKLAGKKFAIFDFDKSQSLMVESMGAAPVSVTVQSIGPKFNNGSVDVMPAPAVMFEPFELYKGLGKTGGIINFALAQATAQLYIRHDRFPEGFGQKSRTYTKKMYTVAMDIIQNSTQKIDSKYWIDLPQKDRESYAEMFRQARINMRGKGIYDGTMLKFLAKIRCKLDGSLAECTAKDSELKFKS